MKILFTFLIASTLASSCIHSSTLKETEIAEKFCKCYIESSGEDIDTRLTPCLEKFIIANESYIDKKYVTLKHDSAVLEFARNVMLIMVENCDSFYHEVERMYINMYPLDTSQTTLKELTQLRASLAEQANPDSSFQILHRLIGINIKTEHFKEAIWSGQEIIKMGKADAGVMLAMAYTYVRLNDYDNALKYIDKAIFISKNKDYKLFKSIIKRSKTEANSVYNQLLGSGLRIVSL
jgi:tetratricopeptide (TPR) repeat protein